MHSVVGDETPATLEIPTCDVDSDSDDNNVQLNGLPDAVYEVHESKKGNAELGRYERVTTARFSADTDDIFMRSMIENYALEEKTKEDKATGYKGGEPTGKFWMDELAAKAAASEVLCTHKAICGGDLTAYLGTYFQKAWGHFDVNRTGYIEVIKMPQFIRFLASDQYFQFIQPK